MVKINCIKVVTEFVDEATGEVFSEERILGEETKKVKKTSTRTKKPVDDDPTPKITLLEGKYQFNNSAIELTQFEPEMKIDIKFEKNGRKMVPVLCVDSKTGNRLTKSFTVSCKGQKRDNLLEFGTIFELIPNPDKEGYYRLKGNLPEPVDDIVDVPEEVEEEDIIDASNIDLDNLNFSFDLDD